MNHPHPDLPYPAKLAPKTLRIVALGGLGEIGRNMTVYEIGGKLLIVDCGVLFPEESQPGIDLILPDFSYIRDRLHDVVAIALTHGHEDHIGAVPYLLKERADIPVVGSKLTLAFTEAKLKERRITAPMIEVKAGMKQTFGPFELEFVAVNHSIPDALAIAIRTEAGLVLATGDLRWINFLWMDVLQISLPLLDWVKRALISLWSTPPTLMFLDLQLLSVTSCLLWIAFFAPPSVA